MGQLFSRTGITRHVQTQTMYLLDRIGQTFCTAQNKKTKIKNTIKNKNKKTTANYGPPKKKLFEVRHLLRLFSNAPRKKTKTSKPRKTGILELSEKQIINLFADISLHCTPFHRFHCIPLHTMIVSEWLNLQTKFGQQTNKKLAATLIIELQNNRGQKRL